MPGARVGMVARVSEPSPEWNCFPLSLFAQLMACAEYFRSALYLCRQRCLAYNGARCNERQDASYSETADPGQQRNCLAGLRHRGTSAQKPHWDGLSALSCYCGYSWHVVVRAVARYFCKLPITFLLLLIKSSELEESWSFCEGWIHSQTEADDHLSTLQVWGEGANQPINAPFFHYVFAIR